MHAAGRELRAILPPGLLVALPSHAQTPRWQWAAQSNVSGSAVVKNIAVDAAGNSYAVGSFTEKVRFGATTLVSQGQSDLFVTKLSPAGNWEWAVAAGGGGNDNATGRVFVTGSFSQHVGFGRPF